MHVCSFLFSVAAEYRCFDGSPGVRAGLSDRDDGAPYRHGFIWRDDRDDGSAPAWLGDARLFYIRRGRSTAYLEADRLCAGGHVRCAAASCESGTVLSQSVLLDQDDIVGAGRHPRSEERRVGKEG